MKIPEELTHEFLSLLLGVEVVELGNDYATTDIVFQYVNETRLRKLNLDTLIRLMIDFIIRHGYEVNIIHSEGWVHVKLKIEREIYYSEGFYAGFKAVLKATNFVAKEKGLI